MRFAAHAEVDERGTRPKNRRSVSKLKPFSMVAARRVALAPGNLLSAQSAQA
jgi:hypothetical protein